MNLKYLRIQTRFIGRLGKPVGIFTACWHLKKIGSLTDEEQRLFQEIEAWFVEHLPKPAFYEDGNPEKGATWFKRETTEFMVQKLEPLMAILDKYKMEYDIVMTNYPGKIIYEDEYQVGVV